ncbi:aliphatic sulfonate ABC transporter substrate-binding protein [Rhizobium sp. Leaf262]|uniref:aliphatic sulfonate ABC transporter substrate-binding protein n=1 Tax=Rhizobium sp. Leaf262 TaxID=1736312 RepID=UPI0009E86942|nr:aliphatic sulfonate ABC transporter substrate-binding protein [Rhizobium sp. Leaf262]
MRSWIASAFGALAGLVALGHAQAADISEIRIDWATYNPVSLVLKNDGLLEKEFEKDGIKITWVQSAGSNKALEFLNASSLDFGSTAGAAALIGRINGNPIKSVYVYSKPEWTALVTRKDTGITKVEELKGKAIAVTRGTDPHIFLVRALADAGLTEKDVTLVLLQHADGRLALKRGDVAAWAGLDPIMASAEIEDGDILFHRNAANNTWGVLNVREEFAKEHPEIVKRVLAAYERARDEARKDPAKLKAALVAATKLPDAVIERQLERTDLSQSKIGNEQAQTIEAAGLALQKAGVVKPDVDVKASVSSLIDTSYAPAPGQ